MPLISSSKTEALANYASSLISSWYSWSAFWIGTFAVLSKSGMIFLMLLCKTNCLLPIPLHSVPVQLPHQNWSSEGFMLKETTSSSRINQRCCCLRCTLTLSWWFFLNDGDIWLWSLAQTPSARREVGCWSMGWHVLSCCLLEGIKVTVMNTYWWLYLLSSG